MSTHPHIVTQLDWLKWLADERPTIQTQFEKWLILAQSATVNTTIWDRCQLSESGITVLLRDRTNCINESCLTIASVQLPDHMQRKGWFKSFLTLCCIKNPWTQIVIEDVNNQHLRGFLERINCVTLNKHFKTTYIVNKNALFAMKATPLRSAASYL